MTFINQLLNEGMAVKSDSSNFVRDFLHQSSFKKYVLGRNIYSEALIKEIGIDGVIDDYCEEVSYHGRPVVRLTDIPSGSLVINAAGGRPLTSKEKLDSLGIRNLDYFCFRKLVKFQLPEIRFNEGFIDSLKKNHTKFENVYNLLADAESKRVFEKLVRFRFTNDISDLIGFTWREDVQYFEDFLNLSTAGESFVDVGAFDGFTSHEFVKRCPDYHSIEIFEPDLKNLKIARTRLSRLDRINFHNMGLANESKFLKFSRGGSCSKLDEYGDELIKVTKLDDIPNLSATFIKIDIEGAELNALRGSELTIIKQHPRLAVSAYHHADDFWSIPELILGIRSDYRVFMRHYTESIYETVLFFIPE